MPLRCRAKVGLGRDLRKLDVLGAPGSRPRATEPDGWLVAPRFIPGRNSCLLYTLEKLRFFEKKGAKIGRRKSLDLNSTFNILENPSSASTHALRHSSLERDQASSLADWVASIGA
jgi:hypothetical protein